MVYLHFLSIPGRLGFLLWCGIRPAFATAMFVWYPVAISASERRQGGRPTVVWRKAAERTSCPDVRLASAGKRPRLLGHARGGRSGLGGFRAVFGALTVPWSRLYACRGLWTGICGCRSGSRLQAAACPQSCHAGRGKPGFTDLPVKLGDRKIARRSWETSEVITPDGNADFRSDPEILQSSRSSTLVRLTDPRIEGGLINRFTHREHERTVNA